MIIKSPETISSRETEARSFERAPIQESGPSVFQRDVESYVKRVEIGIDERKWIDGFLAIYSEGIYQKSVVEGGDKGNIKERMKIIDGLRSDIKKDQIPLESLFLVSNYLINGIEQEKTEVEKLRADAEGDASNVVLADNKEKQIEEMRLALQELASKIMGGDIGVEAERLAGGDHAKKEWMDQNKEAVEKYVEDRRNAELAEVERQKYLKLSIKDRREYQQKLHVELEVPFEEFSEFVADRNYNSRELARAYQKAMQRIFQTAILLRAQKNGVDESAFYGMIEQGLRPYEDVKVKGFFSRKVVISGEGGPAKIPEKGFPDFLEKVGKKYTDELDVLKREKLQNAWEKDHDVMVEDKMQEIMNKLFGKAEMAMKRLEEFYKQAKEKMVDDYVTDYLRTEPGARGKRAKASMRSEVRRSILAHNVGLGRENFLLDELDKMNNAEVEGLKVFLARLTELEKKEASAVGKVKKGWL